MPRGPYEIGGGGGSGGPVDAEDVSYDGGGFDNVKEALDSIFYVAPVVTSFTGGGNYEIGASVASVDLNWAFNKTIVSQSINNGVGSLDPALRTLHVNGPWTTNQTWTITASDGTNNAGASTSIAFLRKRYWGADAAESLPDDEDIIALSQELSTSRGKTINYNCSGGKYPYYVYPTSFGALTGAVVNGLAFSDYTQTIQTFTNAQGHTENYYVTRFNGIQFGASIPVVWS